MADAHSLESIPEEEMERNLETAACMERIAAMLRTDQQDHGMEELAAARKAYADELRAAAEMLHPTGPPEKSIRGIKDGPRWIREEGWTAKQAEPANFNPKYHMFEIDETVPYPPYSPYPEREDSQIETGKSEDEGGWASSSRTTTTEVWHQRSLPRTSTKRKSIQE
jgi:hypothetical protein